MEKMIITIDGRVCSGKSTLIENLQKKLSQYYGHNIPHYSCGEYYRNVLKKNLPNEQVDNAMIEYVRNIYETNDVAIIDGRSSGLSLANYLGCRVDKPVISILCDVNKEEQVNRIRNRKGKSTLKFIAEELRRDRRDKERCFQKFGENIFDPKNYDIYINTSYLTPEESILYALSELNKRTGITGEKKALLFAEESETTLSHKMMERRDIIPIFLRFSKHLNFSKSYLEKTKNHLVFTVNMDLPLKDEVIRFQKWIQEKSISLECFCNDSEFLQEKAQTFARAVGLPALSEEQVLWVRDKVRMKQQLRKVGLPVMNFSPINNHSDIIAFAQEYGFPIMFKPRKGFSSINTYKLSNIKDILELPVELKPDKFMVEVFNPNNEWAIDGLVQGGKVIDSYISHIPVSPLRAVVENKINAHITTPQKPKAFNFNHKELLQKIVSGMGLQNGYIHMETFVSQEGQPTICEFGWRMPGCKIPENHSLAYGFDIYDVLLDIHLGKTVHLKYNKNKKCVGDLYLPNKSGTLTELTPLEDLLKYEGALCGGMFVSTGDVVKPRRAGNEASGYIIVQGNTFNKVKNRMLTILRNFNIQSR